MTIIPFLPSNANSPPFSALVQLDSASYLLSATWNVYGQRWYLSIVDQSNNPIWTGAMVGSPDSDNIYLAPNVFTASTILFRASSGNIEIGP